MSIKDKALTWWAEKTKKGQYVATAAEISDQRQRQFLLKEKLIHPVIKGRWLLKRPEDEIAEVFPLLYWEAVESILARYAWSVRGLSALAVLNGEQGARKQLFVSTKQKTNWKVDLIEGYTISLRFDPNFDERLVRKVEIADRKIPVDIPEKVLIDVSRQDFDSEIKSFIAGTKFDYRMLEALYAKNPKPIVFKRLVRMTKDVKRLDLVARLEKIIESHTHYSVGRKEVVKADLVESKTLVLRSPWVLRQEEQLQRFEGALNEEFARKIKSIKKKSVDQLLKQAKDQKKYDTYHSTTLEGYKITPEEVEALLSREVSKDQDVQSESVEKIKNRMAIVGYSEAFDFVLNKVQADFSQPFISEDLLKDTYFHLFKPSADAGIIDYLTLTKYREMTAFIRGTPYVPPSYEKLPELMESYESIINRVENPVVKTVLAHYLFVTIHPYIDGNGRTARLLMNYLLMASGYSWTTIRADQRIEYFEALKKGQFEGDILTFGRFILGLLEKATD